MIANMLIYLRSKIEEFQFINRLPTKITYNKADISKSFFFILLVYLL